MPHIKASGCTMCCQPIITNPVIFKKLTWADVKYPPHELSKVSNLGWGNPLEKSSKPGRKLSFALPNFEKNIALAFFKAA